MSNNITIQGGLGKDAELTAAGSTPLLKFSVGDSVGYGDKKSTNWWNCALFGARANTLADMLQKGSKVCVTGEVTLRKYKANDGSEKISTDIKVQDVWLIGGKGDGQTSTAPAQYQQQRTGNGQTLNQGFAAHPDDDSDLPF